MKPAIVVETFTYQDFFELTGRGPVITGHVEEDIRKVRPGMAVEIGCKRYTITGVEAFRPIKPTRPIGLLVRGLTKDDIKDFALGAEFSILEEK